MMFAQGAVDRIWAIIFADREMIRSRLPNLLGCRDPLRALQPDRFLQDSFGKEMSDERCMPADRGYSLHQAGR